MATLPVNFAYLLNANSQLSSDGTTQTITGQNVTLEQNMLGSSENIFVYADILTINEGQIALPGQNLTINARVLNVNGTVLVNTSGAPPAAQLPPAADGQNPGDPGMNGQAGASGNNAGNITITADVLALDPNDTFTVYAVGGDGQIGQNGGNGVAGGEGSAGPSLDCSTEYVPSPSGGPGDTGGDAGNGGEGGQGGNGAAINVFYSGSAANIASFAQSWNYGQGVAGGSAGNFGKGGVGGPGGYSCTTALAADDMGFPPPTCDKHPQGPQGPTGADGAPGNAGGNGLHGNPGSGQSPSQIVYSTVLATYTPSVLQCRLVLLQAQMDYMNNTNMEDVQARLSWLFQVTPTASNSVVDPTGELLAINGIAATLIMQLGLGLNYFGFPVNYVPLVSLSDFYAFLQGQLQNGILLENNYLAFVQSQQNLTAQINALTSTQQQVAALITGMQTQAGTLSAAIGAAGNVISTNQTEVETKLATLQTTFTSFCNDVVNSINSKFAGATAKCVFQSAGNILKGVGGNASGYTAALGSVAGEVSTALGYKNQLTQIDALSSGSDLQTILNLIPPMGPGGVPDSTMIIMAESDYQAMIQPYQSMANTTALTFAFNDYLGAVQALNSSLLAYNKLQINYQQLQAQISQKTAERTDVGNQLSTDTNQEMQPAFLAFMGSAYLTMVGQLTELLYMYYQVASYWTLTPNTFQLEFDTVAGLSQAFQNFNSTQWLTYFSGGPTGTLQPFNYTASPFMVELDSSNYSSYEPDGNTQWQDFQQGIQNAQGQPVHQITFSIPIPSAPDPAAPDTPTAPDGNYYPPYWAQVFSYPNQALATNFLVEIPGLVITGGDEVTVILTSCGNTSVMDLTSNVQTFALDPFTSDYVYSYESNQTVSGGTLGPSLSSIALPSGGGSTSGLGPTPPATVGLSPFTTWTLELPTGPNPGGGVWNPGLDLSNVQSIRIGFSGFCVVPSPAQGRQATKK